MGPSPGSAPFLDKTVNVPVQSDGGSDGSGLWAIGRLVMSKDREIE